jgi:sugar phosphate isomerase/epimerase
MRTNPQDALTPVRLSVSDYTFPLLTHRQALELISWLKVDSADLGLMGNRSHVRPEEIAADPARAAGDLRTVLDALELTVADVFLIPWTDFETLAPNHPAPDERARSRAMFETVVAFATELRAPGITLLPGIFWPLESETDSLARAAAELGWRAERAARDQLRVSVEPHVGSLIQSPALAEELLSRTPGLELTLDPSHFVFQGLDQADWIGLLPHARHIHVRGAAPRRMQTSVSASTIDLPGLVKSAQRGGYQGHLALEYVWTDWERCNETDNVSETILLRDQLRLLLRR